MRSPLTSTAEDCIRGPPLVHLPAGLLLWFQGSGILCTVNQSTEWMQASERAGGSGVLTAAVPAETLSRVDVPARDSSSLDTAQPSLETSGCEPWWIRPVYFGSHDHHDGFAPSESAEAHFRHSSWAAPRRRIYAALLRTSASCRRVQHFAECGSSLWLNVDGTVLSLSCNHCHDRLCLPCQNSRQAGVIEGIVLKMLNSNSDCRFVTLTLKHSDAPLSVQMTRLIACFRSLRKHPNIGTKMSGGAWFVEVKLDKQKTRWHPHLHVIVEGEFIDAKLLSECWLHVTGDSYITDIRAIGNAKTRASYVAKYATKPLHNEVTLVPQKLDEFVVAIKGKRLYQCFGTWSKAVVRDTHHVSSSRRVDHLSCLHRDALAGDIQALVWLHQAHARWPRLRKSFPLPSCLGGTVTHPTPDAYDAAPP